MAPISKVTLSVAVQHNKELEKQQAAIQQVIELPVYDWMRICLTVQASAVSVHSTVNCNQFTDTMLLHVLCPWCQLQLLTSSMHVVLFYFVCHCSC